MKILVVCPNRLNYSLGISKVYLEAFEEYRAAGVDCRIIGSDDLLKPTDPFDYPTIAKRLKEYLENEKEDYDVIEIEHHNLPFLPRFKNKRRPVLSCRSSLLVHFRPELERYRNNFWGYIKYPFRRFKTYYDSKKLIDLANRTINNCDIVLLSNTEEMRKLQSCGFPRRKLFLSPYGIRANRRKLFILEREKVTGNVPKTVVMVGTLDPRKGLNCLPKIVDMVLAKEPDTEFFFFGTGFFIPKERDQLNIFSRNAQKKVVIKQSFDPDSLPALLSTKKVGIFPSVWEGCPFGILEMLCAGIRVIGFDGPGLNMLLPQSDLTKEGDCARFANKVIEGLREDSDSNKYSLSQEYFWEIITKNTLAIYQKQCDENRLSGA